MGGRSAGLEDEHDGRVGGERGGGERGVGVGDAAGRGEGRRRGSVSSLVVASPVRF